MEFNNAYEDPQFAKAYSKLQFPDTYYLAYRDLPDIILSHIKGKRALDFGCGAGRSTRFLHKIGFETMGIDISQDMIGIARQHDTHGQYQLIEEGSFGHLNRQSFDLILCAFTFDNIPEETKKVKILRGLAALLREGGILINLVSTPEIYTNEWASFSTKDFPENLKAKDGDIVMIINTAIEDARPVKDILCTDRTYRKVYSEAGMKVVKTHRPLAGCNEPYPWINETRIPPWCIYVLKNG